MRPRTIAAPIAQSMSAIAAGEGVHEDAVHEDAVPEDGVNEVRGDGEDEDDGDDGTGFTRSNGETETALPVDSGWLEVVIVTIGNFHVGVTTDSAGTASALTSPSIQTR